MQTRTAIVMLSMSLLAVTFPVRAQTPLGGAWTYQGKLDLLGSPLNDTADFEFTLWDAEVGPNMIGAVVPVDNVTVVDGQFTVEIDFGVIAFNGDKRWLEIAVRSPAGGGAFTTLDPRQPLTAAPYALQTRGIFVDAAGQVGIGTTNPSFTLQVVGPRTGAVFNVFDFPGDGQTRLVAGLNGNGSGAKLRFSGAPEVPFQDIGQNDDGNFHIDNALVVEHVTGNVGIGTTAPATALDVNGTATATAFVGDGSGLTGISGDDLGDHTATQNLAANGHWLSNDGDDEGVFVTDAGNVGIGTTTPAQKLSVFDGELALQVADNANDQSILFQNLSGACTWRLYRSDAGGNAADFHIAGGVASADFTALSDRLTIDMEGNVGIGTNSPQSIF